MKTTLRIIDDSQYRQILKELNTYGYAHIPGVLDSATVVALANDINKLYEQLQGETYLGLPGRDNDDKIVYNLQNKGKHFIDLLSDPFIRQMCMEKLNDPYYRFLPNDLPNYILSYFNARSSGKELDLHIDSYIPYLGQHTMVMQIAFVLEDQDEKNGCTVVVPGTHQSGRYTDRELTKHQPLYAKAGDMLVWDSRTWHGTVPNQSGRSRWLIVATISRWFVKQNMDIPRSLPQEIYQQLNDEQKVLLGFCSIPPRDEFERVNTKQGYEGLLPRVSDYFS